MRITPLVVSLSLLACSGGASDAPAQPPIGVPDASADTALADAPPNDALLDSHSPTDAPIPDDLGSSEAAPEAGVDAAPTPKVVSRLTMSAHSCFLGDDLRARCWGTNLDDEARTPDEPFVQVVAGTHHGCGLRADRTIGCWGGNKYGELAAPTGTFTKLASYARHTCALRSDGTAACWGENGSKQAVPPAGTFSDVATNHEFSCGIQGGKVVCWGKTTAAPTGSTFAKLSSGRLGGICGIESTGRVACVLDDGTISEKASTYRDYAPDGGCGIDLAGAAVCPGGPSPVPGKLVEIGAYGIQRCAVGEAGDLVCFTNKAALPSIRSPFTTMSTGEAERTCGLLDGKIVCEYGNDGLSIPSVGGFVHLRIGASSARKISAAATASSIETFGGSVASYPSGAVLSLSFALEHGCAVKSDGSLFCFGALAGAGTPPTDKDYVEVGVRQDGGCARKTDGTLKCWGGSGTFTADIITQKYKSIAIGDGFCGVKTDGSLHCGSTIKVPTGTFKTVAISQEPSCCSSWACAIRDDDTAICFNRRTGALAARYTAPTGKLSQIHMSIDRACATRLDKGGGVVCWGDTAFGL